MKRGLRPARLLTGALCAALLLSTVMSLTSANTVPVSKASDSSRAATANDLKPVECAGVTLSAIVSGSGSISGTNAAELITASSGADSIQAKVGNDCLLGGGGDDSLDGGPGNDVCIGGAGANTFTSCETQI